MTIAEIIKQLSGDQNAKLYSQIATVKSVDEQKRVCDVELISDGIEFFDVRIMAENDQSKGVAIIPKKDSFVVVTFISKNLAFISAFSEIEKIVVDFPEISGEVTDIKIKNTKIVLNDGNNDGIVKVKELTQKINNIENLLNNVLTALKGTTIALAPSGSFPLSPIFSGFQNVVVTQKSDIENSDIKH